MTKVPEIDLAECSACESCQALCPDVFSMNPSGYMEVAVMDEYPEDCIEEAISNCPQGCLAWVESG
ncbi:MAG: ferredoxin [Thermodesulfobacteriota bacterium]|nr:ferredoxin [Thermodesulfobacteriota bacterium]